MTHKERAERRKQIAEMIRNGRTAKQVIEVWKVGYSVVERACLEHGITPPYLKRRKDDPTRNFRDCKPSTLRIVAALLDESLTLARIADKFGVSKQRVDQIRNAATEAGIPLPKSRAKGGER